MKEQSSAERLGHHARLEEKTLECILLGDHRRSPPVPTGYEWHAPGATGGSEEPTTSITPQMPHMASSATGRPSRCPLGCERDRSRTNARAAAREPPPQPHRRRRPG